MSLALDVALREIYFNVNGGYMSMDQLYQSAKEEGIKGVSRKNVKEWLQLNTKHLHHSQTVPKALQNPKDLCGRACTTDPNGSCGYE
jgi:hypothetical protein